MSELESNLKWVRFEFRSAKDSGLAKAEVGLGSEFETGFDCKVGMNLCLNRTGICKEFTSGSPTDCKRISSKKELHQKMQLERGDGGRRRS